jgi:hypothetical protein
MVHITRPACAAIFRHSSRLWRQAATHFLMSNKYRERDSNPQGLSELQRGRET